MQRQSDDWLKVVAVARRLGVSPSKVRQLISEGSLPAIRHGKRGMYLVRESACAAYLAALEGTFTTALVNKGAA